MAYCDVIHVAKEQAALLGNEFGDNTLAAFDPDSPVPISAVVSA